MCSPHRLEQGRPPGHDYLINNPIKTYAHATGEMYFLRSDTTLHRTVPLNEDRTASS